MLSIGALCRQYRILEKVGEGGMGVVYRAADTVLGREVALKFILQAQGLDPVVGERFRREARVLAALNHPHIVTIYEIGELDGTPFIALEWVGGGTLAHPSFAGPLPLPRFFDVALPVAEALAAAHGGGIIHRDVKLANVLVTTDGRVKLADFGLARSNDADTDVTRTGGLLGTFAYMSPEQARGERLGAATDVFSFGVLAYELLTGLRPFRGSGPGSLLAAILEGRYEPLKALRADVPAELADVIERCMAKEPTARFQSGSELAAALRRARTACGPLVSGTPTIAVSNAGPDARFLAGEQEIRFTTTADGVSLAYAVSGNGPPIIRVLGHFTHLEVEWEWPELRRFWEQLAEQHTVVRYDGRGMGLSDRYPGEFTEDTRQLDLEAVVDAIGADRAILLGISEGGWTAATYLLRHPERVSHLVLYGSYCRGAQARPGFDPEEDEALVTLIRKGWGRDTPAFRQVITSRFFRSDADPKLIAHFNELQRVSADSDTAARYYRAVHSRGDGRDIFRQVRVPTLVLHCRDDLAVSAEEGRLLASVIPGAQLALLPSGSHYFPTDPEIASKAAATIGRFLKG